MPANPIVPGFNPDPSLIRVGSDYFLATSTFEYFPGVAIHHSKDLINWDIIGHCLTRPSQLNMRNVCPGAGIYAPTIRYWKGRFYMTTSVVYDRPGGGHLEPRGFYVSTDNIWDDSTWSEPVYFDMLGIDQDLFFDDDDRVYLCTARSNHGIRQPKGSHLITYGCEIDLPTGRSLGPPVLLRSSNALASLQATDEGGGIAEGPHIYKRNGWYYLLTAEGGTSVNHQVWIARSKSPLGPYEQPPKGVNPLVFNSSDPTVQATGHADIFQGEDGRWWICMLARRIMAHGKSHLGRETYLAPMEWTEEGWPRVNGGKKIGLEVDATGLPEKTTPKEWRDDFTSDKLGKQWYHLRTPLKASHSLSAKPSHLTLYGSPQAITDLESPCMLLRRQTAYNGVWRTRLDFDPADEWEEAGTTVWYSRWSYIALLVRKNKEGKKEVVVRWTDKTVSNKDLVPEFLKPASFNDKTKEKVQALPAEAQSGPLELEIKATETTFTLSYSTVGGTLVPLAELPSDVVCEEDLLMVTGSEHPFNGTFFGLFSQGVDGAMCQNEAHFDYASWTEA